MMVKEDGDVDGRRLEVEMMMRDEGGETGVEEDGREKMEERSLERGATGVNKFVELETLIHLHPLILLILPWQRPHTTRIWTIRHSRCWIDAASASPSLIQPHPASMGEGEVSSSLVFGL
jgi:hypothetical protein